MPLINTIKRLYAGLGSPTVYFSNANFNIVNGNTTISCPVGPNVQTNQLGQGPITCGILRVKTEATGTFVNTGNTFPNSTTFRILNIWGDDGNSNTVMVYSGDAFAAAANQNIDEFYVFNTDLALFNVNVSLNVSGVNSGSNAVMSVEVAAGP